MSATLLKVIIDSDVAIDYLKGLPYARQLIEPLWEHRKAHLSILSVYELYAGMRENEKQSTDNFINACNIESISLEISRKGGKLYREYRAKGITLTSIDCLIFATALLNGLKIATKNETHYPNPDVLFRVHDL